MAWATGLWRWLPVRKGKRRRLKEPGERQERAFYEESVPVNARAEETEGSGEGQGNADEAELRRRVREVLYRQPGETGLLLRSSRVILRSGRGSEGLKRNVEEVLEQLGDAFGAGQRRCNA